jgi:lipopolysaccharide biosynthesis glycosyltransferase
LPELKTRWTQSEPIPSVASYFNAGVLLIDMERWREEQISEKAVAYLRQFPKTPFSDQDALNVVCDGRWKKLDAEWNQQNHFGTSLAETPADDRPRVVHFITGSKPWNTSQYHPSAAFYDQYRQRTRFARSLSERVRDAVRGAWPTTRALLRGNAVVRKIKARSL